MEIFFKGVLKTDLQKRPYIPGTVTKIFKEALMWKERIESSKKKGAAKHVRHGEAVIIKIIFSGNLKDHTEFQKSGVSEHSRLSCWTSSVKDKAQINEEVQFQILSFEEIDKLYFKF